MKGQRQDAALFLNGTATAPGRSSGVRPGAVAVRRSPA